MATNYQIPNQTNFETQQNYKIDIEKIYNDIIKEIDSCRSFINIVNTNNQKIISTVIKKYESHKTGLTTLRQMLKGEPKESRCHTFFRLIGFPVVGTNDFYNPGVNNIKDWISGNSFKSTSINNDVKIQVMRSLVPGFRELSNFRETYLSDIAKIFNSNTSIDAITLVLSSSTATRGFYAAAEKAKATYTEKSDLSKVDQSYEVDFFTQGLIGEAFGHVSLQDYMDGAGNKPTKLSNFSKRYHIIIPFMVDPWIDFSVCPTSSLVSVPFIRSNVYLRVGENTYAKRPLLEKVIRDRFTEISVEDDGSYVESLKTLISYSPSIKDVQLIQSILTTSELLDQQQFYYYFNIILEMVKQLYEAQQKIEQIQLKYYWLPIPSTTGPEGGVTVKPIIISQKLFDANYVTQDDKDLIEAIIKSQVAKLNSQVVNNKGVADTGNFALQVQISPTPDTTDAYGDKNAEVIDRLTKKRNKYMQDASKALRTIEIIMGEFSGLGLCDIVAIMGALYTVPKEKLLGFLDDDAFSRAKDILGLKVSKPDIRETLEDFTNVAKDFYILMDKLYLDCVNNNSSS